MSQQSIELWEVQVECNLKNKLTKLVTGHWNRFTRQVVKSLLDKDLAMIHCGDSPSFDWEGWTIRFWTMFR